MMMPNEKFLSAKSFFQSPPITVGERVSGSRQNKTRKTTHLDYMDFAEIYADYVVEYEKANSRSDTSTTNRE